MKKQPIDQIQQEFSYKAPGALRVQLAASFTNWQSKPVSMTKAEDGIWRAKVKLPPGTYHYRFIVDGEWHDDPACTLRIPNEFGGSNMLREVRGA
jgi:1,4-alpha-glucan branching enzyme